MTPVVRRQIGAFHWLLGLLAIVAAVICAGVVVWWSPIREALMDPSVPYQTYVPPPAPDYTKPESWALLPTATPASGPVDIFFVHPTTYSSRQWNGPIDAKRSVASLTQTMIPNYAGPFATVGRVFAPRYRQASLYTMMTLREDAREARAFAYGDIRAAFAHYLANDNQGRALILVGVEQGGILADRLAREVVAVDPALKARLAGVYLIETPIAAETYPANGPIPPCAARNQAGCVAAWISEAYNERQLTRERLRHAPVWHGDSLENLANRSTLCFNPLLGATTNTPAPARMNVGAANASGLEWGVQPGFQKHQVSAQCINGVLQITEPRSPSLRRGGNWVARQSVRPFNVFYADIEEDAEARVAALKPVVTAAAKP